STISQYSYFLSLHDVLPICKFLLVLPVGGAVILVEKILVPSLFGRHSPALPPSPVLPACRIACSPAAQIRHRHRRGKEEAPCPLPIPLTSLPMSWRIACRRPKRWACPPRTSAAGPRTSATGCPSRLRSRAPSREC